MAYPDCKVGFEYQGAYHASPEQMRKDAARFNELQHNGWTIIMVTADDLRTEESSGPSSRWSGTSSTGSVICTTGSQRTVLNKKGASPAAGQTHMKYAETALFRHS